MTKSPCNRKCPERAAGCHAGCPRYAEWSEKHAAELAARNAEDPVLSYIKDASRKIAHRRHIKGR